MMLMVLMMLMMLTLLFGSNWQARAPALALHAPQPENEPAGAHGGGGQAGRVGGRTGGAGAGAGARAGAGGEGLASSATLRMRPFASDPTPEPPHATPLGRTQSARDPGLRTRDSSSDNALARSRLEETFQVESRAIGRAAAATGSALEGQRPGREADYKDANDGARYEPMHRLRCGIKCFTPVMVQTERESIA
eukprot:1474820-Rhodomonas_salina.5